MKNRIVVFILAIANLLIAGFIFALGLIYASHTVHNLGVGFLRLLVHIIISIFLLLMLRKEGLRRRDGQIFALLLILSVVGYLAAILV